jgi:hypothetical protein
VIASAIQGLADQRGYLKHGNLLVEVTFPYIDLPKRQAGFLLRQKTAPIAEPASGTSASSSASSPSQPKERRHFD